MSAEVDPPFVTDDAAAEPRHGDKEVKEHYVNVVAEAATEAKQKQVEDEKDASHDADKGKESEEAEEDSWGDEVPVKDLNQSESDKENGKRKQEQEEEGWVTEESADQYVEGTSVEEEEDKKAADAVGRGMDDDHADVLSSNLYELETRLANMETVSSLREKNAALQVLLDKKQSLLDGIRGDYEQKLQERDEKIWSLRAAQLELLQVLAVLKKNHRAFQEGVLSIAETLPSNRAGPELANLVGALVAKYRTIEALAEEKEQDDSAILKIAHLHPIEKLMRLTHNVNPQESSFILVQYFCRLDNIFVLPHTPLLSVALEKAFRFWELTSEFHLYPLYSVVVTHLRMRILKVGESSPHLFFLLSAMSLLFFVYRSEFDPAESTDVVNIRNLQQLLLGLQDDDEGSESLATTISPGGSTSVANMVVKKQIVKTKRALWVELRRLIVTAYAFVIRNEGEFVELCIKMTLEQIRKQTAAGEEVTYDMEGRCSLGMARILARLTELAQAMRASFVPRALFLQILGQLCSTINGQCCNSLMLRRSYATMYAAAAFRGDLRQLEKWVAQNVDPAAQSWVMSKLDQLTEMINVMFMTKVQLRQPQIRAEVCPHLTPAQLCQILTQYEPQRGEEPVPLALIEQLMSEGNMHIKSRQQDLHSVLIDVAVLNPLDLSIDKPNWMSALTVKEIKEAPLSERMFQDYILYRNRSNKKK